MAGKPHNPKRSYPGGYAKPRVPAFEPTDDQRLAVTYMGIAGVIQENIAARLGIDRGTLARHFSRELETGRDDISGMCVGKLVEKIKEGNMTAIIFYLKTRCGWKETQVNEMVGKDGKPLLDVASVRAFMKDDQSEDE